MKTIILCCSLIALSVPAFAQYDDPKAAAEQMRKQEMAKALAQKEANDKIVAQQRAEEQRQKAAAAAAAAKKSDK